LRGRKKSAGPGVGLAEMLQPDTLLRAAGARTGDADLAIVIVSYEDAEWLTPCLQTLYRQAGSARLDVVVVDNNPADGTRALVEERFPQARVITCPNRGFAHANNRGLLTTTAPYVLLLNPDTEIVDGTFGELLEMLDRQPDVGLVGVCHLRGDRSLYPSKRRFPSALHALGDALSVERWPLRPRWLGERDIELERYDQEADCDWTTGAFMLLRREALLSAGLLDERFFLYCEEADLCLRIKRAGWRIRHLPAMTIVHHIGKGGHEPRIDAQQAYSRRQYARKNFAPPHRVLFLAALAVRHAIRATPLVRGEDAAARRASARWSLRALAGLCPPPLQAPPATALDPADSAAARSG
jgi:N-acetylglucosaminyl-diphospho-decaprenol L-rhamnosyltransferase